MTNDLCPCGSNQPYAHCCEPYHQGNALPQTAEQLMRSRYSAFAKGVFPYLTQTDYNDFINNKPQDYNPQKNIAWRSLKILNSEQGGANDETGMVEFEAEYESSGLVHTFREKSTFKKVDGRWYYNEGKSQQAQRRATAKIGRNDPCPCGSGKKYKKCCGANVE